jgi:NADH-quinone oxidoreductase subunit M
MLWMIQRVFYGDLNDNTADVPAPDLDAREHLALWPMAALMLLMGVASPIWMRAIDTAGTVLAQEPTPTEPLPSAQAEPRFGSDVIHTKETAFVIPATEAKK